MKECFIIGGGISLKEGIKLGLWDKIKGKDIWGINYAAMFMPYLPTRHIAVDDAWYRKNKEHAWDLVKKGVLYFTKPNAKYDKDKLPCTQIDITRGNYLRKEQMIENNMLPTSTMNLSGEYAISLAVMEGYERCYILGFDFGTPSASQTLTHWYQEGFERDKENRQNFYNQGRKLFSTGISNPSTYWDTAPTKKNKPAVIKEEYLFYSNYKKEDIEILNVSKTSNLKAFRKITFEEMFETVRV